MRKPLQSSTVRSSNLQLPLTYSEKCLYTNPHLAFSFGRKPLKYLRKSIFLVVLSRNPYCSFNRASSRMARIPSAMRSFSSLILRSSRVVGFGWMYMPRYSLRDICMVLGLRTGG